MPLPRIAIIEDDTDARDILSLILSCEGFAISTFVDCEKALPQLLAHPPALVLLDLNLQPSFITPQLLVQTLKSNTPETKFLLLSGAATIETVAKTMGLGYMMKPFDNEVLVKTVRELTSNSSQALSESRVGSATHGHARQAKG